MKKITSLFLVWFMSLSLVMAIPGFAGINDRDSDINLTKGNVVELPQISAPSGNPDSNEAGYTSRIRPVLQNYILKMMPVRSMTLSVVR